MILNNNNPVFKLNDNIIYQICVYSKAYNDATRREFTFLNKEKIIDTLKNDLIKLEYYEEIGLSSKMYIDGNEFYLPQIDFIGKKPINEILPYLQPLHNFLNYTPFYIYDTGKSYHGYFDTKLSKKEWYKYLGQLLLVNSPENEIIDSRWVGHCLNRECSVLRLTHNSPSHIQYPELIYSHVEDII